MGEEVWGRRDRRSEEAIRGRLHAQAAARWERTGIGGRR